MIPMRDLPPVVRLQQLDGRIRDARSLQSGGGTPPSDKAIRKAEVVGRLLERHGLLQDPINLATGDGEMLFSLSGNCDRRADVWIEENGDVVIVGGAGCSGTGFPYGDVEQPSMDLDRDMAWLVTWLEG